MTLRSRTMRLSLVRRPPRQVTSRMSPADSRCVPKGSDLCTHPIIYRTSLLWVQSQEVTAFLGGEDLGDDSGLSLTTPTSA